MKAYPLEILRRALRLLAGQGQQGRSALELAGRSVGRFKKADRDLSTSRKHLEGFGK
jgi:hypothetical protein